MSNATECGLWWSCKVVDGVVEVRAGRCNSLRHERVMICRKSFPTKHHWMTHEAIREFWIHACLTLPGYIFIGFIQKDSICNFWIPRSGRKKHLGNVPIGFPGSDLEWEIPTYQVEKEMMLVDGDEEEVRQFVRPWGKTLWLQKITDVLQNFVTQFSLAMSDFKALEKVVPLQFSVDSKVFQMGTCEYRRLLRWGL